MTKRRPNRILSLALSAALCLTLLPAAALAEDDRPDDWWMEYYGMGWQTDEVSGMRFYVDEYCNIHWDVSSGGDTPADPDAKPTDPATPPTRPSGSVVSGTCGADITWSLDKESGLLELNGTGEMNSDIFFLTYPLYTYVTDIRISDGITSIGDYAFSDTQVTSVELPDSVTRIGDGAFRRTPLVSVTIPNSVTSIGRDAFYMTKLTSVTIPNSVTSIGMGAFSGCEQLEHASLPNGLTHIPSGMFAGCASLTSLEIPASVTSIGDSGYRPLVEGAFYFAGLTSITIPEGVTSIEKETFYGCHNLTSATIPDSVTYFGQSAFNTSSENLTIYGYTGSPAETMVKTELSGNSVTFVSLGMSAHADPVLKSGFRMEGDSLVEYVGEGGRVVIPDGVVLIDDNAFQGARVSEVTIPRSVTRIGDYAFIKCTGLTSITIPDSVMSIGDHAFESGLIMRGTAGSSAERYARENGLTFEAAGGTKPEGEAPSLDAASGWARETLQLAYASGLIPASLQSSYTQAATRAEFCALATALYETVSGAEIGGRTTFTDTADTSVEKMAYLGVVTGVGGGRFDPDGKLTREQAATMLSRLADTLDGYGSAQSYASEATASASVQTAAATVSAEAPATGQNNSLLPAGAPTFSDKASISVWAVDPVGRIQAAGIMGGVGGNSFAPQGEYTREQSILTMYRLYEIVK